jgi:hypothetical protein
MLDLMVEDHGVQHDGSLRAFGDTSSAADAACRIYESGLFDSNGPDRTGVLAHAAAKAFL